MYGLNKFSDFDNSILEFARLTTVVFSSSGSVVRFRPAHEEFLGWTKDSVSHLSLQTHFLDINGLTLEQFAAGFRDGQLQDYFEWGAFGGNTSQPLPTLWRINTDRDKKQSYIAVINYHDNRDKMLSNSDVKRYYYQAFHLPGFIHNLSGPLGTLAGRTELLRYKHPEIRDLEVMINTARDLRSMLQNFNRKISSEMLSAEIPVNLNQFLHEELQFLRSDQFFKHHVTREEDFANNVPEFPIRYFSLSCLIMELYYFFRQFADQNDRYHCLVRTFREEEQIGFEFQLTGKFAATGSLGSSLPFSCQCNYRKLRALQKTSLDIDLLRQCLKYHRGELEIVCADDQLAFCYRFPLPTN